MNVRKIIPEDFPQDMQDEFREICNEIVSSYVKKFREDDPSEYLEYSKGWHYILAEKLLKHKNAKKVLDIGALFGTMSVFLSKNGLQVTSLDGYVDEIPDDIKLKYNLAFIFANLETEIYPPLPECYFDLVVMSEILEHLNYNPIPVLLMIRKTLNRDGYLIINTPDDETYPQIQDGPVARRVHYFDIPLYKNGLPRQSFPHSKQYKLDEFQNLLTDCGFKIKELSKFEYEGIHMLAIACLDEQ